MRRINVRLPLFIAFGLIVGILSARFIFFGDWWFFILAVAVAIGFFVWFFVKKYSVKCVIVAVLAFFTGVAITLAVSLQPYDNEIVDKQCLVTGRVTDIGRNGEPSNVLYLDDCTLDGQKVSGKIRFIAYDGSVFNTGDRLSFSAAVNTSYVFKGRKVVSRVVKNGEKYRAISATDLVVTSSGDLKADEVARKYVFDRTAKFMPQNADVVYALLCGDRTPLDETKADTYKQAGILHLLAVSGLHVGVLAAILTFFVKKIKLHPAVELAVLLVPLTFYAWICGFTASVVRAVVMLLCVYAAKSLCGKADALGSLGIAATVILLVSPLQLFDSGFRLSFLSVFGIACLLPPVERRLQRLKASKAIKFIVKSLCVSLACTAATAFELASIGGSVPILGALVNLVAVPIVWIAFVLGLIGSLPSFFGYALTACDWLLSALDKIAEFVAAIPFSSVKLAAGVVATAVAIALMFVIGGYVRLGKRGKTLVVCLLSVALTLDCAFAYIPAKTENRAYAYCGYSDSAILVTDDQGCTALICDFCDEYVLRYATEQLNGLDVDACNLYIPDYSKCDFNLLQAFCDNIDVNGAYIANYATNVRADKTFAERGIKVVYMLPNEPNEFGKIQVQALYDGGLAAMIASVDGLTTCLSLRNEKAASGYWQTRSDVDVFVANYAVDKFCSTGKPVLSTNQTACSVNYGANKYGNFTISRKYDKIVIGYI